MTVARLAAAWLAVAALATPASAARTLVEGDRVTFQLGGYARALVGLQRLTLEDPEELPGFEPDVGLGSGVLRLEWRLSIGQVATIDVHNRLFLDVRTEVLDGGPVGVGVTVAPDRTIDLQTVLARSDRLLVEHDLDRLSLRLFLGKVDLALGRQAITWGTSNLFTVADVWAAFSPFDLDQSQKRGIDAVRLLTSIGPKVELDVVVADRGSLDDLSGGVRTTFYLDQADVYVAAGKFWDQLALMAGVSATTGSFKLRAEGTLPWDLDDDALERPRVTLGFDWLHPDWLVSVEAHYNGSGADAPDDYVTHATTSEELARGQVYLLGRYYLGASATWKPWQLVTLSLTTLGNLRDPSLLIGSAITYEPGADLTVSLGAYNSLGARPDIAPTPTLGSELGSYGHLVYMQLAAFF